MFLSKIFFILLALVAAIATTFAVIAPRPFERKLGVLEGQRLDRAQYAAEQMFKVDAHKWIDHVGKLGRDAIIAESLDAASRGSGEYTVIHRTIQDRFRTLIPDLTSGGIDSIVAIDTKGRVIARVGENEKEYGDFIAAPRSSRMRCAAIFRTTCGAWAAGCNGSPRRRCCRRTAIASSAPCTSAPKPGRRW